MGGDVVIDLGVNIEEKVLKEEFVGTGAVTEMGLWMEKKDATWMSVIARLS